MLSTTIFSEGFEGAFPGSWAVGDADSSGTPAYWDKVNSTFGGGEGTVSGSWKGYVAGIGNAGTSTSPLYQNNMSAYMSHSINLTGYTSATLSFWYKIPSIEFGGWDEAHVYIDSVPVWTRDYTTTAWTNQMISLNSYVGGSHTLTFQFDSDGSGIGEGWYLDDIVVTDSDIVNQPDLIGTNFDSLEPLEWGQSFTVDYTVKNRGIVNAGSSVVEFYMSSDDQISSSDYYLGSYTIPGIISAGTLRDLTKILSLPTTPPTGFTATDDVYIGMIIDANNDVAEYDESNNRNVGLGLDKDLVGLVLRTTIFSEGFEGAFPGSWAVGDADSSGTPAYWDKVNSTFGNEGTLSGSWKGYVAGIGNAGTSTSPRYQNNMSAYMTRTIDLTGYTSASLSFWYKIPSIEFGGWDEALVYIDSAQVWTRDYTTPSWTYKTISLNSYVGGSHTLKFQFDSDGSGIGEGWYLDDIAVTGDVPNQADLYDDGDANSYFNPDIVDSPGTPGYGQPWDAYFDIRNGGAAASGSFYVDFYASSNATITPIDHLLGRVTMSSIAGGSYGNADLNLTTFPAGIPAGVYYVGIIIDPTNVVAESNESNNIGVDINGYSLTVTGYRDLYDDGDSWNGFSPTTVQTGQTWSARMDVRNEGTADAAGFWVTFYASTDNIINTGDYFIDDVWVSGVTAGNYVDVDLSSILFPFNIPVGDYYVGTIIDASNSVTESDESNNNHAFDEYPLRVAILGDANNDGVVSADDYGSVQINFGDTGEVGILGDANLDGVVSSDDYGSVQLNFGNTSWMGGMAAVSETTGPAESNNAYVGGLTEEYIDNNNKFTATTVGGPINIISTELFVDLVVDVDLSSLPNQIAKGTWFYTPVTVTNRGNIAIIPGTPGYFTTTLYYSTDDDPVAALEGMEASPFTTSNIWYLAPGQNHTVYLWAHADGDPGTFNLRMLTDVFDSVLETDEPNNWSTLLSGDIV